jgi:hypothetical protein
MTDDSSARNQSAMLSSVDVDYDAIHAAIVATERGRWFLEEYARRYRAADTGVVLAAIERIERAVRGGPAADSADGPRPPDVVLILEAVGKARSDAVGRHGDPAAIGDAALADFRNAVEQIQELVWDMHGRDAASEYGSQLSLQSNRLTSAGDRIESSLGGLRILLALIDDQEQRLRPLAGAPTLGTPSPVAETPSVEMPAGEKMPSGEPPSQTGEAADGLGGTNRPAPILSVVAPEIKWPEAAREEEPVEAAAPQPEPISERASPEGEVREPAQTVAAAQFEPLWQIPEAPTEPIVDTIEGKDEVSSAFEWARHTEEAALIAHEETSLPPLPDVTPEPQVSLVEQQPAPAEPSLLPIESHGHWHEAATAAPPAETEGDTPPAAEIPPPQPEIAHHDETVADAAPVQEDMAEIVAEEAAELSTAWPVETSGDASSAIEWFEVPAAEAASFESTFDPELFDNEDEPDTVVDSAGKSAIDALQAEESRADERLPAVEDMAAEDIEWLTADSLDEASPPDKPTGVAAVPNEIDVLFADAPQPHDDLAGASLDDVSAEPSSLAGSTSDGSLPSELPPEELPPQETAAAASLYADASYSEPPSTMGTYASRVSAEHTDASAGQGETASPAASYNWPSTFARETADSAAADRSSAGSQASAAYHALQSSSLHPGDTEPPTVPAAETPEPNASASGPFAEEAPDVPSVIERLESVRSAIAALMDEVSEKGPRRHTG